jgi:hypothetical protein
MLWKEKMNFPFGLQQKNVLFEEEQPIVLIRLVVY